MLKFAFFWIFLILAFPSCSSYEKWKLITEEFELPSVQVNANYNQAWAGVLKVMRDFEISQQNQEAGIIKTRWRDNTMELNFADSFGSSEAVKAAKFMLTVNVAKAYTGNREISKVTVYKRQLVEQDFLQGWKEVPTDTVFEKTLLYRIVRAVEIDNKLREIDKAREKKAVDTF